MSAMTACWLTAVVLILVAVFFAFALCQAAGRPYPAKEPWSQRVWDEELGMWIRLPYGAKPGPGQLTESEVNALDRFQVELNAIRDERNHHQGDS
jgi:hypothetical protein